MLILSHCLIQGCCVLLLVLWHYSCFKWSTAGLKQHCGCKWALLKKCWCSVAPCLPAYVCVRLRERESVCRWGGGVRCEVRGFFFFFFFFGGCTDMLFTGGFDLWLQEEVEVLQSIYDGDSNFKQISSTSYQYKVLTLQSLVTHLNATRQRVTHHTGVGLGTETDLFILRKWWLSWWVSVSPVRIDGEMLLCCGHCWSVNVNFIPG